MTELWWAQPLPILTSKNSYSLFQVLLNPKWQLPQSQSSSLWIPFPIQAIATKKPKFTLILNNKELTKIKALKRKWVIFWDRVTCTHYTETNRLWRISKIQKKLLSQRESKITYSRLINFWRSQKTWNSQVYLPFWVDNLINLDSLNPWKFLTSLNQLSLITSSQQSTPYITSSRMSCWQLKWKDKYQSWQLITYKPSSQKQISFSLHSITRGKSPIIFRILVTVLLLASKIWDD